MLTCSETMPSIQLTQNQQIEVLDSELRIVVEVILTQIK